MKTPEQIAEEMATYLERREYLSEHAILFRTALVEIIAAGIREGIAEYKRTTGDELISPRYWY